MISILKQYWGYDHFRGIQQDIIESISAGRDTLGLMPTGGGKSITFQVPALAMEGVCIVITPLIALMKDQVQRLRRLGIRATAIYSGMSRQETLVALDNCVLGGIKLLYVSPERLASEQFQVKLRHMHVSFITVDEAHCISQWGYDFRPSYLEIANIRKLLPGVPILALTATATPRVIDDIQEQLQFQQKNVFKMSFERKNLAYIVRHTSDKQGQLLHILNAVPGSAIVYVRSRRRSKEIADFLNSQLYDPSAKQKPATYYHAGLDHSVRDDRQTDWQQDKVRVMVATNAFGMGIDKPDVRLVIHMDCPSSIEAYFQEAGRAGRDGKKAYAVMLYRPDDHRKLEQRIASTFPDKEYILKVYEHLAYYYQMAVGDGYGVTREFDIERFCRTFRHFPVLADAALKILARAGYLDYATDPDNATRIRFLLSREQLYMLSEATPREELVITTLLRNYGGLFTDYAYISLEQIARDCERRSLSATESPRPQRHRSLHSTTLHAHHHLDAATRGDRAGRASPSRLRRPSRALRQTHSLDVALLREQRDVPLAPAAQLFWRRALHRLRPVRRLSPRHLRRGRRRSLVRPRRLGRGQKKDSRPAQRPSAASSRDS